MFCRHLAAALVAAALATPAVALAAGTWPWPLGTSVSLPYGVAYTAVDGRRCTHGGIDIAEAAGSERALVHRGADLRSPGSFRPGKASARTPSRCSPATVSR